MSISKFSGELRKDYILDRWTYYASSRKKRPREFKTVKVKEKIKKCFFCPGNESLTPKEIGRVKEKEKWIIRWFPNKFMALQQNISPKIKSKKFFTYSMPYGKHEVIVETPNHKEHLADLSVDHMTDLLKVYALRIRDLSKLKNIKYVDIFKNHGVDAGTSIIHEHTQVMALSKIPDLVMQEITAVKKYKKCPYCNIIELEKKSKRKVFENKSFVSIAPYASRFNYEVWLFPKRHVRNITELMYNELRDLAEMLKKILLKLKEIDVSYNYYLHYALKNTDLHFHIEVTPRIAKWGGFELSTNAIINSVFPETAAKFYRK